MGTSPARRCRVAAEAWICRLRRRFELKLQWACEDGASRAHYQEAYGGCCVLKSTWWSLSRQRELVTGRRFAPNSSLEAHDAPPTMMEPVHVNETPIHDFSLVAVHGDIERRPC